MHNAVPTNLILKNVVRKTKTVKNKYAIIFATFRTISSVFNENVFLEFK